jgi:hypothetical protein
MRHMAVLVLVVLALGGCGGDGGRDEADDPPSTTVTTTTADPGATEEPDAVEGTGDVDAFCAEVERIDVEQPESYVGSEEHVADVEALGAVAPEEIRPAVERYRDFLASGFVTDDDPATKQTDSWPEDVQADVAAMQEYRTAVC